MKMNEVVMVFCMFLTGLCKDVELGPQPGPNPGLSRAQRDASCRNDLEYLSENICCLNCPAGTYVKLPCTRAGEKGQCEECDYGTFIEHASGLTQCFPCTPRRTDQETIKPCTQTQNAEHQCKPGRFCHPDEACEVCKKCSSCQVGEEVVRNCTATTNTECKKTQSKGDSASAAPLVGVVCGVVAVVVALIGFYICKKRRRTTDADSNPSDTRKAESLYAGTTVEGGDTRRPSSASVGMFKKVAIARSSAILEEEHKMLCESLNSSASNSQHSLIGPLPFSAASPLPSSPAVPQPWREEEFPKLIPVKGEESLRACFDYFEEVSMDYYKRFFRSLGISDNVIKSKDPLPYEDRFHELLNIWVEKVGRDASLNHLLKALLELNQRLTAETIKDKAILEGHYFCEVKD